MKYRPRYSINAIAIRVNKGNVNISAKAYKVLGEPKTVDILYDRQIKAIKIQDNPQGLSVSFVKTKYAPHIGCAFYKVMPMGIYYYDDKENVFKLDS